MRPSTAWFLLIVGGWMGVAAAQTPGPSFPWKSVERILGRPGTLQGDMWKTTFPRTDLNVTVNGIPLEPGLAPVGWLALKPLDKGTEARGALVLLDREVAPVMAQLAKRGFETTALHQPLLNESPVLNEVFIRGRGRRTQLAESLKAVLAWTGTPAFTGETPTPNPTPQGPPDWSGVQAVLGPGTLNGKLLQYAFPRAEPITEQGLEIPPFMGMETTLCLQKVKGMARAQRGFLGLSLGGKTSKEFAAATGQMVLTAEEVQPLVENLAHSHITVTALHSGGLRDEPRLFFLHFWVQGAPEEVAAGLKGALEKIHLLEIK